MTVHLISFDFPYPPVYGGVIDVFNKIRSLNKLGFQITLHCYTKGPINQKDNQEILKYCSKVYLYPRKFSLSIFLGIPYMISSRNSTLLRSRLVKAQPQLVLVEGLHCANIFLKDIPLNGIKVLRMHNVEWKYYKGLARNEKSFAKKRYYALESFLLYQIEKKFLSRFDEIITLSQGDQNYFTSKYPNFNFTLLPAFHPNDNYTNKFGKGQYILFHGDLSISDTEYSLRETIIPYLANLNYKFIIAGRNPTLEFTKYVDKFSWISLFANPGMNEMDLLIKNSHIIVLFSGIKAGIKLKLIESLYKGRFIVANLESVEGTGLEILCSVARDKNSFERNVKDLWSRDFDEANNIKRKHHLENNFNNFNNLERFIDFIRTKYNLWNIDI
jgi:hypothetical protein